MSSPRPIESVYLSRLMSRLNAAHSEARTNGQGWFEVAGLATEVAASASRMAGLSLPLFTTEEYEAILAKSSDPA